MFTVRYPNGQAVQYNEANYVIYGDKVWELYTKENGITVALIQQSAGVIVEFQPACSIQNPMEANLDRLTAVQKRLSEKNDEIIHLRHVIAGLKGARKKSS